MYDAAGQLTKIQKAYGTPLQQDYAIYAYSDNGKRTSVTDANGNKASLVYDGYDRLARWNFPSKTTPGLVNTADYEAYGYDANDNRTSLRKRDGQVIGYAHDRLDRVTRKDVPGTANDVYYDYDLRGLRLFARFGSTSGQGVTTVYDGLGRPMSSTTTMGGVSRTLTYQYDLNGNRTRITHPDGTYFTYVYDSVDRNVQIRQADSTSLITLAYDAPGRRTELQRLNGAYTHYDYDGISRLGGLVHDLAGTGDDVDYGFAYNPASQIVSRTTSNSGYVYANYAAGTESYSVNGLNQYSAVGGQAYAYDPNGNLTSDGATTYAYDIENRLISAAGGDSATLKYDPLGRLYEVSGGGTTTRFLYDGDALVAEYDSAGTVTNRYVHGPGVDEPLVWFDGAGVTSGSRRFLYADHIGSITGITDNTGAVLVVNSYDPYGIADPQNFGRFAFTGQIQIPDLGLYYYKARIYSPALGRFLQTDPIGYQDQTNLYAYVANDPINFSDPYGLAACPLNDRNCVDDPETESGTEEQPGPSDQDQAVDEVVVVGYRSRQFTDGTKIRFSLRGYLEQGFNVSADGIFPQNFTQSGTQECDDGTTRSANKLDISNLNGASIGHTHGGGGLDPLPGPEDGVAAAATDRPAYMMSRRGAFAIESTAVGFRVRLLAGRMLSGKEKADIRNTIAGFNQNDGGSGVNCTFTPD